MGIDIAGATIPFKERNMILSVKQICSARAETKHMMKRNFLVENAAAVLRIFDSTSCIDPRRKMIASSSETAALLEKEAFFFCHARNAPVVRIPRGAACLFSTYFRASGASCGRQRNQNPSIPELCIPNLFPRRSKRHLSPSVPSAWAKQIAAAHVSRGQKKLCIKFCLFRQKGL